VGGETGPIRRSRTRPESPLTGRRRRGRWDRTDPALPHPPWVTANRAASPWAVRPDRPGAPAPALSHRYPGGVAVGGETGPIRRSRTALSHR